MPSEGHQRSPAQRVEDILDNIDLVRRFTEGYNFESLIADQRTYYAVTRALEIISEASRHLPSEMKSRWAAIDWRGMAAVGNVYRHSYDDVEKNLVWDVINRDLEPLRMAMLQEYRALGFLRE